MLLECIKLSGVRKNTAYTTGEAAKIIGVSVNTVISLCDNWTPAKKLGIECYRVGKHRRIPHHALVQWFSDNSNYERLRL